MKKRIISFVLMLVMLFSCLSPQVFATVSGSGALADGSSAEESSNIALDATEKAIAEYFKKYGTIGKDGGYNLTAAQLAAKVAGTDIIANEEFAEFKSYNNSKSSYTLPGTNTIKLTNKKEFERVTPAGDNGNYYLKWCDRYPIATKAEDGTPYVNLEKGEDGKYIDTELQALVESGYGEVSGGVVYRKDKYSGEYIQVSSITPKPDSSNITSFDRMGATFTVAFDLYHYEGVAAYFDFEIASYMSKDSDGEFESIMSKPEFKVLTDGTLQIKDPRTGNYVETGVTLEGNSWTQISITHTPRGLDGKRDVDANGNIIAGSDDNTMHLYVDGRYIGTYKAIADKNIVVWTPTGADGNPVTDENGNPVIINNVSDFTLRFYRVGQSGYGFKLDDYRLYFGKNVEIASAAHENLAYSHTHDIENNKLVLTAICQDDGCGVSETLTLDLCNKQGEYGLSIDAVKKLLADSGRTASACCDFTEYDHANLKLSNGTYKENEKTVIDWYMIADHTDANGNDLLLWQRPVAKNPKTNEPFTEAELATLSETAKALITFENGVPYYTGAVSGEYVQYSFAEGAEAAVKELVLTDPENPIIGSAYTFTMDFTYYGGSFSFQILTNTHFKDSTPFSSTNIYPFKITGGKLTVNNKGNFEEVSGVEIPVGKTFQLTFLHTPRGLDGERDVVNGYSAGDDNTFHIFIDGKKVATSTLFASKSTYKEWESTVDGTNVKMSASSDFTVSWVRMGQVNADQANTQNLYSVDNIKIYRGMPVECYHSITQDPNTCDWCAHEFDLWRCNLCDRNLLSEDVVMHSKSATIGDVIDFNLFLKLNKAPSLFGDDTVVLDTTASGGKRRVEFKISDLTPVQSGDAKGLYKVSIPLRSIDMTREITVSVVSNDTPATSYKVVLNDYLDELLKANTAYYVRQIVKAMKNYGAYAQEYFEGINGNPDDLGALPNANLSDPDKNLISAVDENTFAPYELSITGNSVQIDYSTFVLDSATELRIHFVDSESVTVREGTKALTKHKGTDGYSYVSLVIYSPAAFGDTHTVVFSDGESETTVKFSANAVLGIMHASEKEKTKNLAAAMYLLGKAAYEYRTYYVQGNEPTKPDWDEDGVLKILCIGNSFSVDAMEWIAEIATDLGYTDFIFGNLYIGGCYIDRHIEEFEKNNPEYIYYLEVGTSTTEAKKTTYRGYTSAEAIASENWDFISLQQGSARSYAVEHYKNLPVLIDYVKNICPTATLVWHQTWAYAQWYANEKYSITQENMYKGIVNCVKTSVMTNEEIEILIPSGTAIQNARTSYLGDNLNRDGTHLDYAIGRYIAALTFFAAVTDADISAIEWSPVNVDDAADVDAAARAVAIESVINALENPYEVTQSKYTELPQ